MNSNLRLALGYTVTDAARILRVSRSTVHRWEATEAPQEAYDKLRASGEIDANVLDALITEKQQEIDELESLLYEAVIDELCDD